MWQTFFPRVLILVCKRSYSFPYRLADILGTGSYYHAQSFTRPPKASNEQDVCRSECGERTCC